MPELLVGCPIWKRDWIISEWLLHVDAAAERLGVEPAYIFCTDPRDEATLHLIREHCLEKDRNLWFVWAEENYPPRGDVRDWNADRFRRMVYLRNLLLRGVRDVSPDFFLSLDSDILLHPLALGGLLELTLEFDVVGGKTYMTPRDLTAPSYAIYGPRKTLVRPDSCMIREVDCVMAIKLMTHDGYSVDYEYNSWGEDLGWSLAAKAKGLSLGWDGRFCSKHVMRPSDLQKLDERCGF